MGVTVVQELLEMGDFGVIFGVFVYVDVVLVVVDEDEDDVDGGDKCRDECWCWNG